MHYRELFDLSAETVVQFGFIGPIGRQFASALAQSGCRLILGDLNESDGLPIIEELKKENKNITFMKIDVTDEEAVKKAANYIETAHGGASVLINTFSKRPTDFNKKFEDSSFLSWNDVMRVNLSATYLVCREMSKQMIKKHYGSIINVASFLGVVAPDQRTYGNSGLNSPAIYTTSKSGVVGLTKYLGAYLGKYNVRVNCISPGGVNPGNVDEEFKKNYEYKVPLGRMGNMDDMKGAVVFLASKASQYVNGHNLVVDGGYSIW